MIKKSVVRLSLPIKYIETIDGTKQIGRIFVRDGRVFTLIHGDRVVIIRRKRILSPK
jgi:hypothetical protein